MLDAYSQTLGVGGTLSISSSLIKSIIDVEVARFKGVEGPAMPLGRCRFVCFRAESAGQCGSFWERVLHEHLSL
jgi:hypothetical protein